MKSYLEKNIAVEQSKDSSIKGDKSQKVPVVVADQHEEDDDAIFKRLNIPCLSDKASSFQEGKCIDSEN